MIVRVTLRERPAIGIRCPICHDSASETRFTNGMDSLSVFQRGEDCDGHGEGGPVGHVGNGKALAWKSGRYHFCVMGNASLEELRKVASSLPGGGRASTEAP